MLQLMTQRLLASAFRLFRINGAFPELSVTAFDADNNIVFSQLVYQDGVALI